MPLMCHAMLPKFFTRVIVFVFVLIATRCQGETFDAHVFRSEGQELPYRIAVPDKLESGIKYPLVLFFHGAGERGRDNLNQLKHGASEILAFAKQNGDPAIIIAPQCPPNQQWVDTPWGDAEHAMPKKPSKAMKLAMALLSKQLQDLPIDRSRVYVTGLSMGGFGTWDIVQRMPQTFAAAMPVCGGGDTAQAAKIRDLPIWCFHGGKDNVVLTKRSQDMIAALRAAGGEPKYTEYPDVAHAAWGPAYKNQEALTWLFDQAKK